MDATQPKTRQMQRLIQDRLDAGDSYRTIEKRARAAGHSLSHSQIADLFHGTVKKSPDLDLIAALADGLRVRQELVRRAVFIDWYGYDPMESGAGFTAAVPADLSAREREELDTMIRAWLIARGKVT